MRARVFLVLALAAYFTRPTLSAWAHPGSGIVVDGEGNVYFCYRGLGKLDSKDKVTYLISKPGGHWLCLDTEGSFSRTQPKYFERVTPPGVKPALIFADGGSPIAVLPDGNLYYASNDEKLTPGGLQVTRNSPRGEISVFPPDGKKVTEKLGITGLAAGPDGALYIACGWRIRKMSGRKAAPPACR